MKKFAGFTPEQEYTLLQKMGYSGGMNSEEMAKFISASPQAMSKLNKLSQVAQSRLNKPRGFAEGGVGRDDRDGRAVPVPSVLPGTTPTGTGAVAKPPVVLPTSTSGLTQKQLDALSLQAKMDAQEAAATTASAQQVVKDALADPTSQVTPTQVAQVTPQTNQSVAQGTGQVTQATTADATTVGTTAQAQSAAPFDASQMDATKSKEAVDAALSGVQAATATVSKAGTVQGQLEELMKDFDEGTPPWASGAMRAASAAMASRGLGASSMAAEAITLAAMQAALPIASQDARTVAEFEMQNLNNEQQTVILKTQQRMASIFSDQAADNASKQFNAASENQVKQFLADMQTTVSRFNAEQINSISMFNAGETNAVEKFNAGLEAQRFQFNAQNDLIIAQANAQWYQNISTFNTAAQNEANLEDARQANGMTSRALDQLLQKERDLMTFAFTSAESQKDRSLSLLLAEKEMQMQMMGIKAEQRGATMEGLGYLAGKFLFG